MFKLQNGWTKAKMKKRIKERNTNRRCFEYSSGYCRYENGKNHCAVGVFIPAKLELGDYEGSSYDLFFEHPKLLEKMPLNAEGMRKLQVCHDFYNKANENLSLHKTLFKWIDENVAD